MIRCLLGLGVAFAALGAAPALGAVGFAPAPGSPFAAGFQPGGVDAADLDGDGYDDLVAVSGNAGQLVVLRGGPSGALTMTEDSPMAGGGSQPAYLLVLADVDRDGNADAVTASFFSSSQVGVALGDGAGGFTPKGSFPVGASGYAPSGLRVADMTGDGLLDIVTADYDLGEAGTISILAGNGEGGFAAVSGSPFASGDPQIYDVAVADLNGDGRRDLIAAHYSSGPGVSGLRTRLALAGGGYAAASAKIEPGVPPNRIEAGDLDGDGDADVVVAPNSSLGAVALLASNAAGALTPFPESPVAGGPGAGYDSRIVDLDADGRVEVVTAHDEGVDADKTRISVLGAAPGGPFAAVAGSPFPVGTPRSMWVAVGDFNGDAQPDAAASDFRSDGRVGVLLGQNAGNAAPSADALDFGTLALGETAARSVTLTNSGNGFAQLGAAGVTGAGGYAVTDDGCAGRRLLIGDSCTIARRVHSRRPRRGTGHADDPARPCPGADRVAHRPGPRGTRRGRLPAGPGGGPIDTIAPVLSPLRLLRSRFTVGGRRPGTTIAFTLSEAAGVTFEVAAAGPRAAARQQMRGAP